MSKTPGATARAALAYRSRSWSVIPLRLQEKRPALRWQEFQYRLATVGEVREWFARWPAAGVAIVTGLVSRLIVLDVDPRHGGEASLERKEHEEGALPPVMEARTGGGGRHLYFEHPGGIVPNRVGIAPGLDLRGDGGYVVAPPSLHASGRPYAWAPARDPGQTPPGRAPAWLVRAATERRRGQPPAHWRRLLREGVVEGKRNNSVASLCGHLLWHGVDRDVVLEILLCWNAVRCRPPLDAGEVARTVESIVHLHARGGARPDG